MAKRKARSQIAKFDSQPLKVKNHLDLLVCGWRATYRWKAVNKGYNFVLDFTSLGGLKNKLWASKIVGVPILEILGLPT
jgi:hypothetical protein